MHKGMRSIWVFTFGLWLVLGSSAVWGSMDRGAIKGVVTDPSGGVVPGARVTVKNVDTNVEIQLTTNSAGSYLAPELVPGKYLVHISASGFSPVDVANLTVTAGDVTNSDVQLRVGATTQTVSITAEAPLVETTPSNFSTAIQTRYIEQVPLQGRDVQSILQLVPGVTQSSGPPGSNFGFNSQIAGFPDPLHLIGSGIAANGSQAGSVGWFLDGSLDTAETASNMVVDPSPDAVAEFNVVDNGLAAEWGRTAGAVVSVVLKSGTNAVHGDVYEYNHNSFADATNPFARRNAQGVPFLSPRVNFNNFGGTVGGPVYVPHIYNGKNRTFFFASWDLSFLHETLNRILTVPLAAEKQGDFTGDPRFASVCDPAAGVTNCLYDAYTTTGPDVDGLFHRTPFPTPVIPKTRIDSVAAKFLATYPDPNFVDALQQGPGGCGIYCNNFLGEVTSSQTTHNISVKIDHQISEKHKLFGEYLFNPVYYANDRYPWNGVTANIYTGVSGMLPYRTINQVFALGLTSSPTSSLVNEARFMFSRQNQISQNNPENLVAYNQEQQMIQGLNLGSWPPQTPVADFSIGGIGGFGPPGLMVGTQGTQAYMGLDNVTKVLGKHTIKGGMMFRRDNLWNVTSFSWGYGFGGGLTNDPVTGRGGAGLAQFLLGAVDLGSGTYTYHAPWDTNDYWGFFAQDDFRINSRLTISYGLRYDIFGWFRERHDDLATVNLNVMNPQTPYLGAVVYVATPGHPDRNMFPAHKGDFGPRFSFSWTPFADRKTVVRGNVAMIYTNGLDAQMGNQNSGVSTQGYSQGTSYANTLEDFTYQHPAFQLSKGAPTLILPNLNVVKAQDEQFLGTEVAAFTQGSKDPYITTWSLYVQRELPANVMVSVGYVGTHGMHLIGDEYRNWNYIPTAVRQKVRENIFNYSYPVDASLGPIYGCSIAGSQAMCPGIIGLLPYPQYAGGITPIVSADGFNRYNSFVTKVEKRYSQGLNLMIAYTIQKNLASANFGGLISNTWTPDVFGRPTCIGRFGLLPGAGSGGGVSGGYQSGASEDPENRRRYTALAPDDIPQILNLAMTYALPVGKGKHFLSGSQVADKVLGGWKITQNWNFQSGVPMRFYAPCNGLSCMPNLLGDPSSGRASKTRQQLENQWFNPSAFEAPFGSDPSVIQAISTGFYPDGTALNYNTLDSWWQYGNAGVHPPSGRAPGFWNVDAGLAKEFHFTENKYFELHWQVFNALNHQNLGIPNYNWCLPPGPNGETDAVHIFGCQFGKITNVQTDPRTMQFGLKFFW